MAYNSKFSGAEVDNLLDKIKNISTVYPKVSHGTADTSFALTPNTLHTWGEVTSLTLTLGTEESGVANEYLAEFVSGSTATSLSLPDTIKWLNGKTPEIASGKTYQLSILDGLAVLLEF